jgi:DNA-binding SARP family transcriptional activator/DNA-binding HxlR family transcriptional regulator
MSTVVRGDGRACAYAGTPTPGQGVYGMQFERWSLPVIGEALLRGTTRREEFQSFLGIAPELLDSRLVSLVASGILSVELDSEGGEHFVPTQKGRGLEAALHALDHWSREWDPLSTGEMLDVVDIVAPSAAISDIPEHTHAIRLSVLDTFELLVDEVPIELSPGSQRLLVFLALRDRAVARISLAGTMWPDASESRAGDSLRSAIARLEPAARAALSSSSTGLRLADTVAVDLREGQLLAHRLLHAGELPADDTAAAAIATLSRELLPDWYDDWVLAEAEDWRFLRTNALEALAHRLLETGELGEAARAARAAMRIDPLRESPHAALIRVQLAMGNQGAAREVFERYAMLLDAALGLAPTKKLAALIDDVDG